MRAKILIMLLVMLAIVYSAAPTWVAAGANLNYSVGTDTISFTVLNRTNSEIKLEMLTLSTAKKTFPTENATLESGQFWFENTLLPYKNVGDMLGGYEVTSEGTQRFAGKDWNTITLQGTIGGAATTKVLDKDSGLLLKQSVDAAGAPVVTLTSYYVPAWVPPPSSAPSMPPQANNTNSSSQTPANTTSPPPPPPNTSTTTNSTNQSVQNTTMTNTSQSEPEVLTLVSDQTTDNETEIAPTEPTPAENQQAPRAKKPLCPSSAFVLLLLGCVAFYSEKKE